MTHSEWAQHVLRDTIVDLVRRDERDLSTRQLAVLLICALEEGQHTVRGLALRLKIAKPSVTRAVDRLEEYGLAERMDDPRDRRSVLIVSTKAGQDFVSQLAATQDAPAASSNGQLHAPMQFGAAAD